VSTRYLTNLAIALFGGFIVVESLTFSHPAERWVAFAVAIVVAGISLAAQLDRSRGLVQRALDGALIAAAGTLIGVSVVYTGMAAQWIAFALALGLVGTSVSGMTLNEVGSWRAEHGLAELRPFLRAPRLRAHPAPAQETPASRAAS
jgi:hypothetical protein